MRTTTISLSALAIMQSIITTELMSVVEKVAATVLLAACEGKQPGDRVVVDVNGARACVVTLTE